ncbi:phosphopentomutase [Hwanghaeella sp.]|uniref:phosphopentomutase n=1 Tax=Hwanghaeella sp. TaxID=2605943 RepID=UPI003CCBD024
MARAIILVMDSFGIGAAPDAAAFGDAGADTLGHIAQRRAEAGRPLSLPNLTRLGLGEAARLATGNVPAGLQHAGPFTGAYGAAAETSKGKDTPSGHWEIAGLPVDFDWGFFPRTEPCFPADAIEELVQRAGLPGILGNKHASGTEIIKELGEEHIRTGKPICYTSADSVFQIAAHEEHFGLERLYEVCEIAKQIFDLLNIGRVIARPFIGEDAESFKRTGNRRDYTTLPHAPTLLDSVEAAGGQVISVGKIADIFAHKGITRKVKADGNEALFEATLAAMEEAGDGDLVFSNFVDFDMHYGHRRDVVGYADALEWFDKALPVLIDRLRPDDLVLITADHGCDPTFKGTDHTREFVPVLFFGPKVEPGSLGRRATFADMGQTIARHLGLGPLNAGDDCFPRARAA